MEQKAQHGYVMLWMCLISMIELESPKVLCVFVPLCHILSPVTVGNFQLSQACYEDSLYPELCIDSCDDFGADRPELAAVVKYGAWVQVPS